MTQWVQVQQAREKWGRHRLTLVPQYRDQLDSLGLRYQEYTQRSRGINKAGSRVTTYHLALWVPDPMEAFYLVHIWSLPAQNVRLLSRPGMIKPCPA